MKRYFILLVTISVCWFFGDLQEVSATSTDEKLIYLPLDSRPVNTDVPKQMGEVVGVNVLLPTTKLLGNLEKSGNTEALADWLIERSDEVDGLIISIDMLVYGGLVASRTLETSEKEALARLELLAKLKKNQPDKKIYVYSSLLRLAPTLSKKEQLDTYETIRSWGIWMGDEKKNEEKIGVAEEKIPEDVLSLYKKTRERNLAVNEALLRYAKNGTIDVLIYGQDDAAGKGIHQQEKARLQEQVAKQELDNVHFVSGIDEVGSMLLTRFALTQKELTPSVSVMYDFPFASFWTAPFDATHVANNVQEHLVAMGLKQNYFPFSADFILYVNTPLPNLFPLPTNALAVADIAKVNQSDSGFVEDLLHTVPLDELYAYSGWNTAGNTIGLSLSFAGARLLSLENESKENTLAHTELLYRSFLLDNGYKAKIYDSLKVAALKSGDDPYALGDKTNAYEMLLNERLQKENEQFFKQHFDGTSFSVNTAKTQSVEIDHVTLPDASLPWQRLFEIGLSPTFK